MKNNQINVFLPKRKTHTWRTSKPNILSFLLLGFIFTMLHPALSIAKPNTEINANQQQIEVKGIVRDSSNNEPLIGVTVSIKGTTKGTSTNINGEYTISVPNNEAVIVFSFIGYKIFETPVNSRSTIDVILLPISQEIDEIIVIAYGTTTKSNLTGSAVALKSEALKDIATPNIANMLQGKIAGVYIQSSSGRPGAGVTINIRGKSSLSNTNSPLWVVDGIVMGNSDPGFSPSDIESITILKDASATSLYGSLAANGVILVQTKRAVKGVSKININVSSGYSVFNTGNFSLMNSQQLYDYHKLWDPSVTEDVLTVNNDWVKVGTQTGKTQEYNISYSGGTDKISSYISGTYYNESGAVKGYNYQRFSSIANLEIQANKRLKIKTNLSGDYSTTSDREHSMYSIFTYMPWDEAYLPDGTPLDPRIESSVNYLKTLDPSGTREWYGRDGNNYLYDLQYNYGKSRGNNVRANVGFDYKINEWLTFASMNNIALGFGRNEYYTDPRSFGGLADKGNYNQGFNFDRTRFTNQMFRFNKGFGLSNLNAFIAWEYSDSFYEGNSATGKGIAAGLSVLNATSEAKEVSGYKSESAKQSFLVNLQYEYNNKYMVTASFNRQGSSSFGPNNRYGNFWSASMGWNAHYESFLKNISWLNVLKLTASMGQVGNAPSGFQYLGYYELTGQYNGVKAARPYQKGNPDISWEKITSYNFGLNTRLFKRVSANLDIYNKNSDGLLTYVPLPAMSGYSGVWMNIGKVQNRGFELSLTPELIKSKKLEWEITFNVAYNKNEVKELYEDKAYTSGNKRIEVGYDMDSYYQRIWYGVNPGNGAPLWEQVTENGDGTTTKGLTSTYVNSTLQYTGSKGTPSYTGGIINTIRYTDFTLSANIGFVQGIYLYNSNRELFDSDGSYSDFNHMNLAEGWSRWEKPGDIATHPKPQLGGSDANKNSSRYLENASYIRLRNVTLSYQLPKRFVNLIKVSGATVFLSGDNLFTITQWSGMDPETGSLYPLTKKFMTGIKIDF